MDVIKMDDEKMDDEKQDDEKQDDEKMDAEKIGFGSLNDYLVDFEAKTYKRKRHSAKRRAVSNEDRKIEK